MKSFITFIASTLLATASVAEIGIYRVEPRPTAGLREMKFVGKSGAETLYVDLTPVISGSDFVAVKAASGKLSLQLSDEARGRFTALTKERCSGRHHGRIAIVLDGEVLSAPIIRSEFSTQWIPVDAAGISQQQFDALVATIKANGRKG